ncbi:hypothetical protein L1987_54171 [Smallanthus sonchifolius]|uniref:Uncharacterized protein n=1 Tax=Smallanthus sonchifolius TaxID=185202 RepID=A0ACB9E5Y4_9ASTR|nr:hypothetical protein L1987_54171 [Smallanthus sonchifolius]
MLLVINLQHDKASGSKSIISALVVGCGTSGGGGHRAVGRWRSGVAVVGRWRSGVAVVLRWSSGGGKVEAAVVDDWNSGDGGRP